MARGSIVVDSLGRRKYNSELAEERHEIMKQANFWKSEEVVARQNHAAPKFDDLKGRYEMKRARHDHADRASLIELQVAEGLISEEEGLRRTARRRMRDKEEEVHIGKLDEAMFAGAGYESTKQVLDDILDRGDRPAYLELLLRYSGIQWLQRRANLAAQRRKARPIGLVERYVKSTAFEVYVAATITGNMLLLGVQLSQSDESETRDWARLLQATVSRETNNKALLDLLEQVFTLLFVLELGVRIGTDWLWVMKRLNLLDVALLLWTTVMPSWILPLFGASRKSVLPMRVLQMIRLLRVVHVIRFAPTFRVLWRLIRALLDSGRTLLWTYVLLSSVLYIFSVFGVYWIGKADSLAEMPSADLYFGNVPNAFVTLFQTATLDTWAAVARPLMKRSSTVWLYFIIVIMVVNMALVNLITAVIVKAAQDMSAADNEIAAESKRLRMLKEIDELEDLFEDLDANRDGTITKVEFDKALDPQTGNPTLLQKFAILEIEHDEREEIWELLDANFTGEVTAQQFAQVLRALQGTAKAKESFAVVRKVLHANETLQSLSLTLKRGQDEADELRREVTEAHRQMGALLVDLREVMVYWAVCVPRQPAQRSMKEIETLDTALRERLVDIENDAERYGTFRHELRGRRAAGASKKPKAGPRQSWQEEEAEEPRSSALSEEAGRVPRVNFGDIEVVDMDGSDDDLGDGL